MYFLSKHAHNFVDRVYDLVLQVPVIFKISFYILILKQYLSIFQATRPHPRDRPPRDTRTVKEYSNVNVVCLKLKHKLKWTIKVKLSTIRPCPWFVVGPFSCSERFVFLVVQLTPLSSYSTSILHNAPYLPPKKFA